MTKDDIETALKTAYKHRDMLKKMRIGGWGNDNDSKIPIYILAYWTLQDKIQRLEYTYQELSK